ncbi:hypothetical protein J4402_00120 [Candidatus Pacearchaeota archaeon]|nr:hypothetical protein [Candidatus Pacearchaeota archaeon]
MLIKIPYMVFIDGKMAEKSKTREITITEEGGKFTSFFKRFKSEKSEFDFEGLGVLRNLLSNEKARMLNVIKNRKPNSIYELARILKRDFKSVSCDVKALEKFGFIDMIAEKTGKRERLKPILAVDSMYIHVKL